MNAEYEAFLRRKSQSDEYGGFAPLWMPRGIFDYQESLAEWNLRKGKSANFADCGLGKTVIQLTFAENVVRKTNKKFLYLAPLGVAQQTEREAVKFDVDASVSFDGKPKKNITIGNYDRLHLFNPDDYIGVICDESSVIKAAGGQRRKDVTRFMSKMPYRLLGTATAAPNDFTELGTSSEALGQMGYTDVITTFFKAEDDYNPQFKHDVRNIHGKFHLKEHARHDFWRWICSFARACRKPSDVGAFSDELFMLPELITREHAITNEEPLPGELFVVKANTLQEQRAELKMTIRQRCEMVASLVAQHDCSVMWCDLDDEADLLERIVPGAVQISGKLSIGRKEEIYEAFSSGQITKLVTKSKISGFGLNWQHCNHATYFPAHSYERYYQSVRRFWRFGQKRPVYVDMVTTEGERGVLNNLKRKSAQAEEMFNSLVMHMNNELRMDRIKKIEYTPELPQWLN